MFVLRGTDFSDAFAHTLRLYQCIFSICVTQLLLDFEGVALKLENSSKQAKDRVNKDPGAAITHSQVERWSGFNNDHPLSEIGQRTKQFYLRTNEARHNLIYRPYFENREESWFWEDCTLEGLLRGIPTVGNVEQAYTDFYKSIGRWIEQKGEDAVRISLLFKRSISVSSSYNPPFTLLLNYARVLQHSSQLDLQRLDEIRK